MPISLRQPGNSEYTTQATMSLVNLHTNLADPVRRLLAIRDGADAIKALARRAKGIMVFLPRKGHNGLPSSAGRLCRLTSI